MRPPVYRRKISIFLFPVVHRHDLADGAARGGAGQTADAGLAQHREDGLAARNKEGV